MKLTAELKYSIADEINIEGRSKADVIQDVFDELVMYSYIFKKSKVLEGK